jgi:thiol-disulfide isomerase/thioredoxin
MGTYDGIAAGTKPPHEPSSDIERKRPVEVKLWDVATGEELLTLPGNTFDDNQVEFSPDGKTLAYRRAVPGEQSHCVVLWDLAAGKERFTFPGGHVGRFSPDGKLLMTQEAADVTFWDTATGKRVASLKGDPERHMAFLSFSRDWRLLVTSSFYSGGKGNPAPQRSPDQVETEITVWEFTDRPVKKETRGEPRPAAAEGPKQAAGEVKAETRPAGSAWETLKKEIETVESDLGAKRAAAKAGDEVRALGEKILRSREGFVARALAFAREHPRDPAALEALATALRFTAGGDTDALSRLGAEAVGLVRRDHLRSPSLDPLLPWLAAQRTEGAEGLMASVLEQNPQRTVRGRAAFWLARTLAEDAEAAQQLRQTPELADELQGRPESLNRLRAADPGKMGRRAEELFELLKKDYSDVKEQGLLPATLGEAAEQGLFALRNLAVGRTAPEIDGKDLEGKPFKLSDYRGKVVVLVFCGFWCGPCRAMVPHERELVKRLEGRPFALLWVNSDQDPLLAKEKMEKEQATWRSWWDADDRPADGPVARGRTDGPIARRWNVTGWPTVYVIDGKGVIRYKQVQDEWLDRAVDALLKEMGSGDK